MSAVDVEVIGAPAATTIVETFPDGDIEWAGLVPGIVEVVDVPQIADVIEVSAPGFVVGTPGGEQVVKQEERIDLSLNDYTIFRGEAVRNAGEDEAIWRIRRVTLAFGDVIGTTINWAQGDSSFSHKWSERYNYAYG